MPISLNNNEIGSYCFLKKPPILDWSLTKKDSNSTHILLDSKNKVYGSLINFIEPVFGEDRFGNKDSALNLDGISSYVIAPKPSTLSTTDTFSISAWFYSNRAQGDNDALLRSSGHFIFLEFGTAFYIYTNDGLKVSVISEPPINQWHHVVGIVDSNSISNSTLIKIYVDGVLKKEETVNGYLNRNLSSLLLGEHRDETSVWDGRISDITVYDYVLNDDEIEFLYSSNLN